MIITSCHAYGSLGFGALAGVVYPSEACSSAEGDRSTDDFSLTSAGDFSRELWRFSDMVAGRAAVAGRRREEESFPEEGGMGRRESMYVRTPHLIRYPKGRAAALWYVGREYGEGG